MASIPKPEKGPAHARRTFALRATVGGLAALDVFLLVLATRLASGVVRDGAGSVTTGYNLALAIGVTLVAAAAISFLPLPRSLRGRLQAFALGAQALHAIGHLARWYYVLPWYDDALHFLVVLAATLLALDLANAWDLFPERHHTRARVTLVALVAGLAMAGAWEIFEFAMDEIQSSREQDDLKDTMMDMIDGGFGSAAAALVAMKRLRPRPRRGAGH